MDDHSSNGVIGHKPSDTYRYSIAVVQWNGSIFREVFSHYGLSEQINMDDIAFSWSYDRNLSTYFYRPSNVFKQFSFIHLLESNDSCLCNSAKRFQNFLDPLIASECSDFSKPSPHVRSMDLNIIQHPKLRAAILLGLNHIPLSPTDVKQAIRVTVDAFA